MTCHGLRERVQNEVALSSFCSSSDGLPPWNSTSDLDSPRAVLNSGYDHNRVREV